MLTPNDVRKLALSEAEEQDHVGKPSFRVRGKIFATLEFVPLAGHPLSGMPRVREFRTFVLDGKPLLEVPYWDDVDRVDAGPTLEGFTELFAQVRSRFFTADLAQRRSDGRWMLVELGDAQVSGLPERADRPAFFAALRSRLA